jgi:hypothetical protein
MIRRLADNDIVAQPPGWLLIDQIDHALISAEFAACLPEQTSIDELVVKIIRHHDDGWRFSDDEPAFDHANGRPYDFRELPSRSKNQIWSRSIEDVFQLGPLAQFLVARHFLRLRQTVDGPNISVAHREFALRFQGQSECWLADWQALDSVINTEQEALRQLAKLEWLDDWSVWMCCAERQHPWRTTDHQGRDFCLMPDDLPRVFHVDPWPFAVDELKCEVSARFLPANDYANASAMREELVHDVSLSWVSLSWQLLPR